MASMGMQLLASALCLLGYVGVIISCIMPMWRVTAFVGSTIVTAQIIWEGIWMSCAVESTGHMQCKVYDSLLALGTDLQATRAFIVLAIIVGGVGLILAFVGGKCTRSVVRGFYSTTVDAQKRELGASLCIGWGASILLCLGGGLFISSACTKKRL
ncbi:claudin-4-like [Parambassis ranga]|uniref:Claudin-4-like n=1 Tax=Parambassis ranga TaxID=210632 RepID=A0A6P7JLW7_9TELE|nr:claudin-4-like [Parambassis ranga]